MKFKIVTALCVAAAVSFALCGCSNEVKDLDKEISSLGEITLESQEALNAVNAKYEALDSDKKQQVENIGVLEEANERMAQILYAEVKRDLEEVDVLKGGYFAQHYDMSGIDAACDSAQKALDASAKDQYADAYTALESELTDFNEYVKKETEQSYSVQTDEGGSYPFAVNPTDIEYGFCVTPLVKRSSKYPFNLAFSEGSTTDDPTIMTFSCKDESCVYACKIKNVKTKCIEVQDENGELQKAYVNTEVVTSKPPLSWGSGNHGLYPLGKGACYLFQSSDHGVTLAVKDLVEKKGFVLYHW